MPEPAPGSALVPAAGAHPTIPSAARRRFEAVLFDRDGAAATRLRGLVDACCAHGLHLAIVGGMPPGDAGGPTGTGPPGPGHVLSVSGHLEQTGAARQLLGELWALGVSPSQVLIYGDAFAPPDGDPGRDSVRLHPVGASRFARGGPGRLAVILEDQLARRRRGDPPSVADDPGWSVSVPAIDPQSERAAEAILTIGDGRTGTRGSVAFPIQEGAPAMLVAGVYRGTGPDSELLPGPPWQFLGDAEQATAIRAARRRLDLHSCLLWQEVELDSGVVEAVHLASLDAPGTVAVRAGGPAAALQPYLTAAGGPRRLSDPPGSIAVAFAESRSDCGDGARRLERLAAYTWSTLGPARADTGAAADRVRRVRRGGYEALLHAHRRAWAARWEVADVRIDGDDEVQLGVRLAIHHLIASTACEDEAPVGARALTGGAYRGHVFWDAEAFVLPFHAATHPAAARAMLEYRHRRLPAACREASDRGRDGACFPWESGQDGHEIAPLSGVLATGVIAPVRTGQLEDHVAADIAWGAEHYLAWTADAAFAHGPRQDLLAGTARFWASRVVVDHDGAHIRNVIGPDEDHEDVDDNAFTNVMARWNLRAAARAGEADGDGSAVAQRAHWNDIADALVDGYRPASGLYEQFDGFFALEDLRIADVAPRRPVSAPLLLGHERVAACQVVKQADVLMLHYLVPEETVPGSLEANLDFYEPRTAHGSSLSPGVHAALYARAGRPEDALTWLRVTAAIDLHDTNKTTGGGVHLAAMGSLWRALVWGFTGATPTGAALALDPRPLPGGWRSLEAGVVFRGIPVRLRLEPGALRVTPAAAVTIILPGSPQPVRVGRAGLQVAVPVAGSTEGYPA